MTAVSATPSIPLKNQSSVEQFKNIGSKKIFDTPG